MPQTTVSRRTTAAEARPRASTSAFAFSDRQVYSAAEPATRLRSKGEIAGVVVGLGVEAGAAAQELPVPATG
ncbi:MAG: hypothetical protein ACLP50_23515 [Solirubrobacteraceae bacterium]